MRIEKVSDYKNCKPNMLSYKAKFQLSPQQERFKSKLKSDSALFKSFKYNTFNKYDADAEFDALVKEITPNAIPNKLVISEYGNEPITMMKKVWDILLEATKDFGTFKYKTFEKILNNEKIMQNRDVRDTFMKLLDKHHFLAHGEYSPAQQSTMNLFLDNKCLYGNESYFEYVRKDYSIDNVFGIYPKKRDKLTNQVLQKIVKKGDMSKDQITLILRLLSYARTKGNKEVKMAQMIIDDNLAPEKIDYPNNWFYLRKFVAGYLHMHGDEVEFLNEFKQLDNIKNNEPFIKLLEQMNRDFKKRY